MIEPVSAPRFVYHRVPAGLRGTVLFPLNRMEEVFPDLYAKLRENYATREDIASLRIPPLDYCLWNDVLHLSSVSPLRLQAALADAGHVLQEGWRRFFRIDARLLAESDTVIYRLSRPLWSGQFDIAEATKEIGRDCLSFTPEALDNFAEVPAASRNYYASVPPGSNLPYFLGVPHVLYRGQIETDQEGVRIVEV